MPFGLTPWRSPLALGRGEDMFTSLQREMNRMFEDFVRDADMPLTSRPTELARAGWRPSINVSENENEIRVTAELPGMEEKDIDVTMTKDTLTLKGEKAESQEQKDENFYRMERSFGAFERTIELPCEIETEKVDASFKNGILTVHLPKTKEAKKEVKKIPVHAGEKSVPAGGKQ